MIEAKKDRDYCVDCPYFDKLTKYYFDWRDCCYRQEKKLSWNEICGKCEQNVISHKKKMAEKREKYHKEYLEKKYASLKADNHEERLKERV